jgi:tRNA(Ile)-lysidine synthase TilS/MesJ
MKKIVSLIRRAVEDYDMIRDGDRVAVGVSGGKDSLALLCALAKLSEYYPKKFEVCALTLDMAGDTDYSGIQSLCGSLGVEYHIKRTNIREIIFDLRKEKNPCSLCAKMRRGALNDLALEHGCRTIALGHHNDDVIETFFLSLLYEGRVSCFSPVTYLSRKDVYQIRPMVYVSERDIRGAARRNNLPVTESGCPADGITKREDIKTLISELEQRTDRRLKTRLFTAIQNSAIDGWKI